MYKLYSYLRRTRSAIVGLISINLISLYVFYPLVWQGPRADHLIYLYKTNNIKYNIIELLKLVDFNKLTMLNDTDMFRPFLYLFLGLERFMFTDNYIYWNIAHLLLLLTLLNLIFIFFGLLGMQYFSACVFSLGSIMQSLSLDFILWHHLTAYVLFWNIFLIILILNLLIIKKKINNNWFIYIFILSFISFFVIELGILAVIMSIGNVYYSNRKEIKRYALLSMFTVFIWIYLNYKVFSVDKKSKSTSLDLSDIFFNFDLFILSLKYFLLTSLYFVIHTFAKIFTPNNFVVVYDDRVQVFFKNSENIISRLESFLNHSYSEIIVLFLLLILFLYVLRLFRSKNSLLILLYLITFLYIFVVCYLRISPSLVYNNSNVFEGLVFADYLLSLNSYYSFPLIMLGTIIIGVIYNDFEGKKIKFIFLSFLMLNFAVSTYFLQSAVRDNYKNFASERYNFSTSLGNFLKENDVQVRVENCQANFKLEWFEDYSAPMKIRNLAEILEPNGVNQKSETILTCDGNGVVRIKSAPEGI